MAKIGKGFTLLEMLIAVAIIGILAAIAIPNYQAQVENTRRSEARVALVETGHKLERCFAQFGSYNHANCTVLPPLVDHYTISIVTATANSYSLVAEASGAQSGDTRCAKLEFDHSGQQSAKDSDGNPSVAACWK